MSKHLYAVLQENLDELRANGDPNWEGLRFLVNQPVLRDDLSMDEYVWLSKAVADQNETELMEVLEIATDAARHTWQTLGKPVDREEWATAALAEWKHSVDAVLNEPDNLAIIFDFNDEDPCMGGYFAYAKEDHDEMMRLGGYGAQGCAGPYPTRGYGETKMQAAANLVVLLAQERAECWSFNVPTLE